MANAVALLGDFAKFMHESDIRRGVEPRKEVEMIRKIALKLQNSQS